LLLVAWCSNRYWLALAACGLKLVKKFLAAFYIRGRQRAVVLKEPWQQIIVFNSLRHLFSFLNPSYSILHQLSSLKLKACGPANAGSFRVLAAAAR